MVRRFLTTTLLGVFWLLNQPLFAAERLPLSIVTYNIRFGANGIANIAETLKKLDPDFVFMQEVHGPPFLDNWVDQSDYVAKALQMEHFFGKARLWISGEYGLAILSRYPFLEKKIYMLPTLENEEQEVLLEAKVETPVGPVMLYTTHITYAARGKGHHTMPLRKKQAEFIMKIILEQTDPVIFGADLNSYGTAKIKRIFSKHMMDLFAKVGKGSNSTFPAKFPVVRIDYLYLRGPFQPWQSRVIKSYASDHRPLWGKVELAQRNVTDGINTPSSDTKMLPHP